MCKRENLSRTRADWLHDSNTNAERERGREREREREREVTKGRKTGEMCVSEFDRKVTKTGKEKKEDEKGPKICVRTAKIREKNVT